MDDNKPEIEETECICGRSTDGKCHCCECSDEHPTVTIDEEEFLKHLNDWD